MSRNLVVSTASSLYQSLFLYLTSAAYLSQSDKTNVLTSVSKSMANRYFLQKKARQVRLGATVPRYYLYYAGNSTSLFTLAQNVTSGFRLRSYEPIKIDTAVSLYTLNSFSPELMTNYSSLTTYCPITMVDSAKGQNVIKKFVASSFHSSKKSFTNATLGFNNTKRLTDLNKTQLLPTHRTVNAFVFTKLQHEKVALSSSNLNTYRSSVTRELKPKVTRRPLRLSKLFDSLTSNLVISWRNHLQPSFIT